MTHSSGRAPEVSSLWRLLLAVLIVLLLLVVAHDIDHVVNEERLGELSAAFWAFLPLQYGVFIGVLVTVWRRATLAPVLAAALGVTSVVAFTGAHVVPFGPFPYADGDPLAISWTLVFVPVAVAIAAVTTSLRLRTHLAPST